MAKNKWVVITGVLLSAAIIIGFILLQQRNHARQAWQENQEQISRLNQEISALNDSSQEQKDQLSASADLIQKNKLELDTSNQQLQQAIDRTHALRQEISSLEKRLSAVSNERDQLLEERQNRIARLQTMESNDADKTATIATRSGRPQSKTKE